MKTKSHTSFVIRHLSCAVLLAALTLFVATPRAPAQTNTMSAADFQRLVYSADLHAELTLKPELEACLQVLLEMQRRNPNADPAALVGVLTNALQIYRTSEPYSIRTDGYPDEILAAYLDALRQVPARTNFIPANLTLLNVFMLGAADYAGDYSYINNYTPMDLVNSAKQKLLSAEGKALKRQGLVADCMARAQGNAAFASAMDHLLWPETGVWLGESPANIIGDTNSPLHGNPTMTTLLAWSTNTNGSLTVYSNQLSSLFKNEMQTILDTVHTNLAVLAQINQSQPDYLAYLNNPAALDANAQLIAAVQQYQPVKLASATAAVLVQSQLQSVNTSSADAEKDFTAVADIAIGIGGLCMKEPDLCGLDGVLSGGLDLFNLFSGGQSQQDVMATELQNIQTMIGDLSTNMNYRFDRVDQSLNTIFGTMNQQFSEINITLYGVDQGIATLIYSVNDIRSQLVSVQSGLDFLAKEVFENFNDAQHQDLIGEINADLLYQLRFPNNGPITYSEFLTKGKDSAVNIFTTYATSLAGNSISCPDLGESPEKEFNDVTNLACNLNYIKHFLASAPLNLSTGGNSYLSDPPVLVNPDEWFIAAYAYLQLVGENPMYFRHMGGVNLSNIVARGQNDADFCGSLTFNPTGTTNINWNLWTKLGNYYSGYLTSFTQQVANTEMQFATSNLNHFDLLTWRQWDSAAPHVTATNTAVLAVTPKNLIAAGQQFSLGLTPDGKVVGWGWNAYGQTTIPAGLSNVVAIAAGITYSLALRADGTVIGWGYNYDGEATGVPNGTPGAVSIGGQPLSACLKTW